MLFDTARCATIRLSLAAAALVCASGLARAQHVVTEDEAAKLTFEALTAPPPPPRPIYRAYFRRAMASRVVARREAVHGWHRSTVSLRDVAFTRLSYRHGTHEMHRVSRHGRFRT